MSIPRHELPREEVFWIGLRPGLIVHLCGCLYVVVWIALRTQSPFVVLGVIVQCCSSIAVPLIAAGGVTEFVELLRRHLLLPIPLFTRVCVILIEAVFFGWVVIVVSTYLR